MEQPGDKDSKQHAPSSLVGLLDQLAQVAPHTCQLKGVRGLRNTAKVLKDGVRQLKASGKGSNGTRRA
eukprot:11225947-Lingulodinium_polyedra.AAC.1